MRCVKVVIANKDPLVSQGLANLLNAEDNFNVIAGCTSIFECLRIVRSECPDIAIIETPMSNHTPELDIPAAVAAGCLFTRVIFLTASSELRDLTIASANASYGLPLKGTALAHCLRQITNNQRFSAPAPSAHKSHSAERHCYPPGVERAQPLACLTEREREIMYEISDGISNKEAARRLNISEGTIKIHLHHIYNKLAIRNRAALVAMATTHTGPIWLVV